MSDQLVCLLLLNLLLLVLLLSISRTDICCPGTVFSLILVCTLLVTVTLDIYSCARISLIERSVEHTAPVC
jgi:hypothetical protein